MKKIITILLLIILLIFAYIVFGDIEIKENSNKEVSSSLESEEKTISFLNPTDIKNAVTSARWMGDVHTKEGEDSALVYTNEKLGFSVELPERWDGFKTMERDNYVAFGLKRNIELAGILEEEYGHVFSIAVFPKEKWEEIKNDQIMPFIYIEEYQSYVYVYNLGHDDGGYESFPDIREDEVYHGPFWDVQNRIIPSFNLGGE